GNVARNSATTSSRTVISTLVPVSFRIRRTSSGNLFRASLMDNFMRFSVRVCTNAVNRPSSGEILDDLQVGCADGGGLLGRWEEKGCLCRPVNQGVVRSQEFEDTGLLFIARLNAPLAPRSD